MLRSVPQRVWPVHKGLVPGLCDAKKIVSTALATLFHSRLKPPSNQIRWGMGQRPLSRSSLSVYMSHDNSSVGCHGTAGLPTFVSSFSSCTVSPCGIADVAGAALECSPAPPPPRERPGGGDRCLLRGGDSDPPPPSLPARCPSLLPPLL